MLTFLWGKMHKAEKIKRDPAFGERMSKTCDDHPRIPPYNNGRLAYIQDQLLKSYDVRASRESIRRWIDGEVRPRGEKAMRALATMLNVDYAWLSLGITPDAPDEEARVRPIVASGAITFVAGMAAMNGATIAFTDKNDPNIDFSHFTAIVDGRVHFVFVSMSTETPTKQKFILPNNLDRANLVGVIKRASTVYDVYRFDPSSVSKYGVHKGGYIEFSCGTAGSNLVINTQTEDIVYQPISDTKELF